MTTATMISTPITAHWRDFLALTKPRVMTLVVFTGLCGLLAAPGTIHPVLAFTAILCIALGAGAAASLNQWYEADIDAKMKRTANRPLPAGRMDRQSALHFGVGLSFFSVILMGMATNWLAAAVLAVSILFYVFVYTIWLKPRTAQNIVIGGAAGAFPPVIGWAAVTGDITALPIALFMLIFFWTPPHFWALAWLMRDDYAEANVPMLPVVADERDTAWQILLYTIVLVPLTALLFTTRTVGWVYLGESLLLGGVFIAYAAALLRDPSRANASRLYRYSLLYLTLLFVVIMVESVVML